MVTDQLLILESLPCFSLSFIVLINFFTMKNAELPRNATDASHLMANVTDVSYGARNEADIAGELGEGQPLSTPVRPAALTPLSAISPTLTNGFTGGASDVSSLTPKQQREQEELTRRILILGEQPSPTDADFEVLARHSHMKPATALEQALPAIITTSPHGEVQQPNADLPDQKSHCKLYPYRFFILLLFCLLSMSNSYQWLQFSIIQNIVTEFYDVSDLAVDWTSLIYMAVYVPLIFPSTWLLDKWGLRTCILAGAALNCAGAVMKCFSASPNLFAVTFVGQTLSAVAQVFILGIPPQLAAVWFGPREVSTACSFGVFGNQVGVAIGFVLPPQVIRSFTAGASSTEHAAESAIVANDLFWLFIGAALVTGAVFLLIVIFFRAAPPHPPSFAQARNMVSDTDGGGGHYMHDLKQLGRSRNFLLLLISYGINTGIYYAIGTRLNYIILYYFPGKEQEAGLIGLSIVLAGLGGSIICGIVLDRTKMYKLTTAVTYFLSLAATIGFAFLLDLKQMWLAFIIAAALGFFMTGYLPVGFEFAVELTYPVQEGTSSGLLNASSQVFGIIITLSLGAIQQQWSVFSGNIIMAVLLAVGFVLTVSIRATVLKRAQASMLFGKLVLDNTFLPVGIAPNDEEGSSPSVMERDTLTRQNTLQNAVNTVENGKTNGDNAATKMFY